MNLTRCANIMNSCTCSGSAPHQKRQAASIAGCALICMWAAVTLKWERAPELTLPLRHVGNALDQACPTCGPTQPPPGPCHHDGSSGTRFDYNSKLFIAAENTQLTGVTVTVFCS